MRIRNNKRHLVSNKEYSRLPYWTDEGYDDVQRQTSQKYVQDNYGKFAESENQPPYLNDSEYDNGYQGLEYQYQNPEYFDPTDLPDVDFTDTVPKGTCYELWNSLFGDATGTFIPTASEWNKLNEYAKKCPLIYMPHICCLNMKITGPDSVAPGETVEYSVSGGGHGCAYDIDAKRGEFIGYKYTAPTTPGSDRLSIKPWMSDDQHTICAYKDILIEGGCKGTVHATTPQMQVGASQTLYITGGNEADTYYWSTTTGSLSATEGESVTYTAPATNANCASNPTITVTCGGNVVDSIEIAINGADGYGIGYLCEITNPGSCIIRYYPPGVIYSYAWSGFTYTRLALQCNGTVTTSGYGGPINMTTYASLGGSCAASYAYILTHTSDCLCLTEEGFNGSWGDCRSAAQKTAGCCPSKFMGATRTCRYC